VARRIAFVLTFFVALSVSAAPATPPASAAPAGPAPVLTLFPDRIGGAPAYNTDGQPLVDAPRPAPILMSPEPGLPIEGHVKRISWNRLAFGGWGDVGSVGVLGSWFQLSQDEVLRGVARAKGYGFGLLVDFPTPAEESEGLRLQVGGRKQTISGTEEILATDPNADLETSLTLLSFSLLYRWGLPAGYEGLWAGVGGGIDYVYSSARNGGAGPTVSRLVNSYGFKGLVAAGVDIAITPIHDVATQITWQPLRGYSLMVGARIEM